MEANVEHKLKLNNTMHRQVSQNWKKIRKNGYYKNRILHILHFFLKHCITFNHGWLTDLTTVSLLLTTTFSVLRK